MTTTIKYPHVVVHEFGRDGNAFALLAQVQRALRGAGLASECQAFHEEATSGDYNHLLRTCLSWVTCDHAAYGDTYLSDDEDEDEDWGQEWDDDDDL